MRAVFDTNILVDYLQGRDDARVELARYRRPAISVVSWIEVMVGTTPQTETATRAFLARFDLLGIDGPIAEQVADLRRTRHIKLPDAIIWATALVNQCLLVTRNSRDMDPDDPSIRMPYVL